MTRSDEIDDPLEPGPAARRQEPPRFSARLLIGCADRPGIVAAVSSFLFGLGANIVSSHQYSSDPSDGRFFLRMEFFLDGLLGERERFLERFEQEVAEPFGMEWKLRCWGERQRVGVLVSRQDHCLVDLLWRWRRGELDAEVIGVISNHRDLEPEALASGVPFYHVPVEPLEKQRAEAQMLDLLRGRVDLVVLARYMQILCDDLCRALGPRDQHPSLVPAGISGRRALSRPTNMA